MIDQTKLPEKFVHVTFKDYRQVARAIREMVVRGAPAIGVAAAMGMALAANASKAKDKNQFLEELRRAGRRSLQESSNCMEPILGCRPHPSQG